MSTRTAALQTGAVQRPMPFMFKPKIFAHMDSKKNVSGEPPPMLRG
jgi:hypothetical protein